MGGFGSMIRVECHFENKWTLEQIDHLLLLLFTTCTFNWVLFGALVIQIVAQLDDDNDYGYCSF